MSRRPVVTTLPDERHREPQVHERHLAGWAITALWAIIANEPAAHACMPHFDFIMTEKERQEAPARCDRGEAQGCVIAFEDRHASDRSAVQSVSYTHLTLPTNREV